MFVKEDFIRDLSTLIDSRRLTAEELDALIGLRTKQIADTGSNQLTEWELEFLHDYKEAMTTEA